MIRKTLIKSKGFGKGKIAWRSHEPLRIEAFSDAVFGFTVSLLVFSLEVPKNSSELLDGLWAFIPFIFCFVIIFMIWHTQYRFFRHYGLKDNLTMALNAALLVLVLFYVYPLKFMFAGWMLKGYTVQIKDRLPLIYVYIGGYMAVYLLFALMYGNAYRMRAQLKLSDIEAFETQSYIYDNLGLVSSGLIVIAAALILNRLDPGLTFSCFAFFSAAWPIMGVIGHRRAKLFRKKFGHAAEAEVLHGVEE